VHLRWWWPAYLVGLAYERLVNASERFSSFRAVILLHLKKTDEGRRTDDEDS